MEITVLRLLHLNHPLPLHAGAIANYGRVTGK